MVVGLRAGDVGTARAAAVHAAGEPSTEDLYERTHLLERGRREGAVLHAIEELAVSLGDRRDVLGFLLAALDLEAADPGVRDLLKVIVGAEVLGGDEVAAVEFLAVRGVGEHVVLAARLRARAAVRAALGDHPRHVALAGVGDAERAVHEGFEAEPGYGRADRADVVERVLACEHHALDAQLLQEHRAARVVDRHLRGAVDLEAGIDALDEANEPDVLNDGRVDAAIDAGAEVRERVLQFTRLEEDVEREVDACAVSVGDEAGLFELVERKLRALVAGVELLDTEVNGVGSVRDGGADGVEGAGWGEELGTGHL